MPLVTLPFDSSVGPILLAEIARPSDLDAAHGSPGKRIPVRFLIDSGASHTSVTPQLAHRAELPVLGQTALRSVTHEVAANLYLGDLFLPIGNPASHFKDFQFLEFPLGNPSFDGLLGRDLLQFGLFQLNGPARNYILGF